MKSVALIFSLLLALYFTISCGQVFALDIPKHEIKAEVTLRLIDHVFWPHEELIDNFRIALVGDDPKYYRALNKAIVGRKIRGKRVHLSTIKPSTKLKNIKELLKNIHILVVGKNIGLPFSDIAIKTRDTNTLLISSEEKDHLHIMINFFLTKDDTLTFEFNRSNILLEELTITNNILLAGGSELDVAYLFRETEIELQKIKQESRRQEHRLTAQEKRLAGQERTLGKQSKQLDNQKNKLGKQTKQLAEQIRELSQQEKRIRQQTKRINQQQQDYSVKEDEFKLLSVKLKQAGNMLKGKQEELVSSQDDLYNKQADLREKEERVLSLGELIEVNNQILETQQQELAKQNLQMSQLKGTIGQQQSLILATLMVIVTFGVLLLVILRINQARKRINLKLATSNVALKETQSQLQDAKQVAELANHAKSSFLSNMSHEIRTPMNAILGYAQLMQQNSQLPWPEVQRNLEIINRSGEHLLLLINDVLEMSKIEAGSVTLNLEHFEIAGLLHDVEKMFEFPCEEKNLRLLVEPDDELPEYFYSDRRKISQILINLLSNSVKFTQEGGISLRVKSKSSPYSSTRATSDEKVQVENEKEQEEGTELKLIIEVEDSGCGIAPQDNDKVFANFEQTQSGLSSGQGTGLGLSITREYAHLMGGEVTFSSVLGQGSVFRLELSCELGDLSQVIAPQKHRQVVALQSGSPCKRILIVDDNKTNRDLLKQLLSSSGFDLIEASNGEEALKQFENDKPDLILMDERMPVMTGAQAIERIKATTAGKNLPIIVISASAFDEDKKRLLSVGADGFIAKPFKGHEVLEKIGMLLHLEFHYDEAPKTPASHPTVSREKLAQGIAELPQQIIADLRLAVIKCDTVEIRQLIALIENGNGSSQNNSESQKALAQTLTQLTERFNYEALAALLE